MYYGLHASSCGEYADARTLAELARQAEAAGWDGFFIWDHVTMSLLAIIKQDQECVILKLDLS